MEKIGLEGVFKTEEFAAGLNKYTSGLTKAMSTTTSAAGGIASVLGGAVVAGAAAFAALGVAAIAAGGVVAGVITKMVFSAATLADSYSQMSGVTGVTTTRLQELAYAGKLLDVDVGVMNMGLKFLTRNMFSAKEGTGATADAFKELGIKVVDSHGKLRDADVVFGEVIDKLGLMQNETERDAVAMKIMGRSAMELNPLINAGSKVLAQYSAEAHTMGAVVSEEGITALDLFQDRMDALKLSLASTGATLALNFLPAFAGIEDGVRGVVKEITSVISESKGNAKLMGIGFTKIIVTALRNVSKSIPQMTKSVKEIIKTITSIIVTNAPALIRTGMDLLSNLVKGIAENIPLIMSSGKEIMRAIGEGLRGSAQYLPTGKDIIDWIFSSFVNITAKIKEWFGKIDWAGVSQSIIDFINGIDWAAKGEELRKGIDNLGITLLNTFNTIKWSELGVSIGTGFSDFIIGAMSPGQNLDTLRATWQTVLDTIATTITTYGWNAVGQQISDMIGAGLTSGWVQFMGFRGPFRKTIDDWWVGIGGSWRDVDFWGSFLIGAQEFFSWKGPLHDPVSNWWISIGGMWKDVDWASVGASIMSGIWNGIMAFINWKGPLSGYISSWWNGLGGSAIPAPGANWGPASEGKSGSGSNPLPSVPPIVHALPGGSQYDQSTPAIGGKSGSTNTYNTTINNPVPEQASTSVDKTLRRWSYLGNPA